MDSKEMSSLLNPVRMKIFQLFLRHDTETVKRIAEELPDVPPASLYRHINKLVEADIIEICAEYKIRGTVERVYRLKSNPFYNDERVKDANTEELFGDFYSFNMVLLSDFENYLNGSAGTKYKEHNFEKDRVSFRDYSVYLSDEECDQLVHIVKNTLSSFENNKGDGERRLRKFSFVMIPGNEKKNML
ncbi:hypothetical protein Desdi_1682 [Desulfitobacterium dichloroeliminans LMG P-21439]|uniref:HTH arsR-type domain-containing protein n=1 Tax=Desulfitobacterium dichloroeliminans (strain LMG P-21439 / DCA1) TaxID=871963 RepID=L0F940_DESDL|nr:helix-turn-helix domain-containing protein [Desulfitobacterium dichloroeliminans]AGA69171.1 hypothetical protein Desdi_1682 [Desulfitobacterium dichloroeliminans LMG P-21439]